jgi:hypothetical protein
MFRSFDDFQNVLGGFFVKISPIAEAVFVQRGKRETDIKVFRCSGIFSAFNFWLADGHISIKNKQYQY